MSKCWFCGTGVSDNPEYSQSIEVGLIKKKEKAICEQCSVCIKCIDDINSSDEDVNKLLLKMKKNNYMNKKADKYIAQKLKKRNIEKKREKKTLYCVRGVGVPLPNRCTNCLCQTSKKETLINIETSSYNRGNRVVTNYNIKKMKFGLCQKCRKTRESMSARIMAGLDGDVYSIAFTNKDYAILFAKLNRKDVYEREDSGDFEYKTQNTYNIVRYCWLWIRRIISLILLTVLIFIALKEIFKV